MTLLMLGCSGQQTSSNPPVVPTPEPTPDRAAIETELSRIENDWPRVIKERDGAAVRRMEADDVTIIYPDGSVGRKEDDVKDIEAGSLTADSWEITALKVNVVNANLATVSLINTVKNGKVKSPDGRTADISGKYQSLDTFVRRNGQWQYLAMASVKLQPAVATASPTPKASPSAPLSPAMKPSPVPKSTPQAKPSPERPLATPARSRTP